MNREEFIAKLQMVYVGDRNAFNEIVGVYDNLKEENQRLNNVLNELERHLEQEILEWKDCSDEWTKAQVQEDKIILDKLNELKESDK